MTSVLLPSCPNTCCYCRSCKQTWNLSFYSAKKIYYIITTMVLVVKKIIRRTYYHQVLLLVVGVRVVETVVLIVVVQAVETFDFAIHSWYWSPVPSSPSVVNPQGRTKRLTAITDTWGPKQLVISRKASKTNLLCRNKVGADPNRTVGFSNTFWITFRPLTMPLILVLVVLVVVVMVSAGVLEVVVP